MVKTWKGDKRADGVMVARGVGSWVVLAPENGGESLTICPCCSRPMASPEVAKHVADRVYPPDTGDSITAAGKSHR